MTHDTDLGTYRRSGSADDHERGQYRAQFLYQTQADRGSQQVLRAEFAQVVVTLQRKDHPGESTGEQNYHDRPRADKIDLANDRIQLVRRDQAIEQAVIQENSHSAALLNQEQEFPAEFFNHRAHTIS